MALAFLVAGTVVVLLLLGVLTVLLRSRAETRRELALARAQSAELSARLDALSTQVARSEVPAATSAEAAYVITDAGAQEAGAPAVVVRDRVVLSATLGEPLVKAVALGHGVRRALSAESRNRIRFEMRREVRRTRKQRRREMKDAWRQHQADERAAQASDQASDRASDRPVSAA